MASINEVGKIMEEETTVTEDDSGRRGEAQVDEMLSTMKWEEYNTWIFKFSRRKMKDLHTEKGYEVQGGDVMLASVMKTGTTWMKSLLHSIICCVSSLPNMLEHYNAHDIVPTLEEHDLSTWPRMTSPRLIATHLPFQALPSQLRSATSTGRIKMVYVTRNPRDTFVSLWKFWERMAEVGTKYEVRGGVSMEKVFESFCAGRFNGGPFPQHVAGYFRESKLNPESVMFVRYEDMLEDVEGLVCMLEDVEGLVCKLGSFLGYPEDAVRENACAIATRCSLASLSGFDVNKSVVTSVDGTRRPNTAFFRSGKKGGWKEYFTPEMQRLIRLRIEDELDKEGVHFDYGVS